MFDRLIAEFKLPEDDLAGSAPALSGMSFSYPLMLFPFAAPALIALSSIAYSTACNLTAPHLLALAPPAGWDGPFGQGLTTGTTVVTFIAALILGLGSITVVNTM